MISRASSLALPFQLILLLYAHLEKLRCYLSSFPIDYVKRALFKQLCHEPFPPQILPLKHYNSALGLLLLCSLSFYGWIVLLSVVTCILSCYDPSN